MLIRPEGPMARYREPSSLLTVLMASRAMTAATNQFHALNPRLRGTWHLTTSACFFTFPHAHVFSGVSVRAIAKARDRYGVKGGAEVGQLSEPGTASSPGDQRGAAVASHDAMPAMTAGSTTRSECPKSKNSRRSAL